MDKSGSDKRLATEGAKVKQGTKTEPEWTSGLKKLYNSVVDEPLPDSFKNLLAQLDAEAGKK